MSNLRTEQPVFETDRITDGFDIFFWVFNDASSFVATHWHTAIEIMYIIDGEIDVMMNQQTVILKPGYVFLIYSSKISETTITSFMPLSAACIQKLQYSSDRSASVKRGFVYV